VLLSSPCAAAWSVVGDCFGGCSTIGRLITVNDSPPGDICCCTADCWSRSSRRWQLAPADEVSRGRGRLSAGDSASNAGRAGDAGDESSTHKSRVGVASVMGGERSWLASGLAPTEEQDPIWLATTAASGVCVLDNNAGGVTWVACCKRKQTTRQNMQL